ncbi:MAG: heme-binding protein [Betaproteobacteria bacterium]|jgi:glc operon protein GlcG
MKALFLKCSFLTATCLLALGTQLASAQAPANPADIIPDKMPFDFPFGTPIKLEKADQLLNTALAEAQKREWKLICSIADPYGQMVAMKRMDNAQIASIDIAIHKARTAAKYRRETKLFELGIANNPYLGTLDDVIASRGGIPLIEGGKLIGAIGCSGGTGSQDEVIAKVGAALVK